VRDGSLLECGGSCQSGWLVLWWCLKNGKTKIRSDYRSCSVGIADDRARFWIYWQQWRVFCLRGGNNEKIHFV
jgi:hypothetical protein